MKEVQLNQAPGLGNYDTPDIIDLDGVLASHVAIICEETFHESSGGKRRLAGLSEVQFIGSISGANKYNNEDTLIQTPLKSHIISDRPLQVGQWHHVVVTFTSEGYKQIYINGVSAGVPVREVLFRYLGTDMYIGAVPGQQNIINLTKPFTGSISELALYDRTLTPDEIKRIYQTAIESY